MQIHGHIISLFLSLLLLNCVALSASFRARIYRERGGRDNARSRRYNPVILRYKDPVVFLECLTLEVPQERFILSFLIFLSLCIRYYYTSVFIIILFSIFYLLYVFSFPELFCFISLDLEISEEIILFLCIFFLILLMLIMLHNSILEYIFFSLNFFSDTFRSQK